MTTAASVTGTMESGRRRRHSPARRSLIRGMTFIEMMVVLAIIGLLLALVGLMPRRWGARGQEQAAPPAAAPSRALPDRRHVWIFAALALASLLFVFGTPLYALLYYGLPGISQLHSPFRWVFPYTLSVAVLAGFGAARLGRRNSEIQGSRIRESGSKAQSLLSWADSKAARSRSPRGMNASGTMSTAASPASTASPAMIAAQAMREWALLPDSRIPDRRNPEFRLPSLAAPNPAKRATLRV